MRGLSLFIVTISCILFYVPSVEAKVTFVTSQQEFDNAHDNAAANDSIVWPSGTYTDIYMDIEKDRLYIGAETLGGTIFTGASKVDIDSDYITFRGF